MERQEIRLLPQYGQRPLAPPLKLHQTLIPRRQLPVQVGYLKVVLNDRFQTVFRQHRQRFRQNQARFLR